MKSNNDEAGSNDQLSDLKDSAKDAAKMKPETVTIDLPDVSDIPGQENMTPVPLGELADATIASADEEADDLFDDAEEQETAETSDSDVSASEIKDLEATATDMPTPDNINLQRAALDDTDEDGTELNEGSFNKNVTGSEDEETGEEDEENNEYSLGGDNNDDVPKDNF
jgi:antitoxin component HigA of HigAB toxin-antitoxin module